MINVYAISTNNVDIYRDLGMVYPGGIAINVSCYLCRAGHKASYVGWVGNDAMGLLQYNTMKQEGVDVSKTKILDMQQDWCSIKLEDGNNRVFKEGYNQIGLTHKFSVEDVKQGQIGEYDVIYSNIECSFEPDAWKQLGNSNIPVAYDFSNYWDMVGENRVEKAKGVIDYFYMSLEHRPEDPEEFTKKCVEEYGATIALATLGTDGSILYNGRKHYRQKAYLVDTVDTMGAGDMFLSSFTASYVEGMKNLNECAKKCGWTKDNPNYMECEDSVIERSLSYASMMAAYNCMEQGAIGHGIAFDDSMTARSTDKRYKSREEEE